MVIGIEAGCLYPLQSDYLIGNALYDQGKYDEAEQKYTRALEIFRKENPTHPTTSTARLKLSCIAMQRGHCDAAMYV
jgi:Uncharacterized protein conserved in bacteria